MENSIDHGTLVKWVNESDDATVDSRENSEKCRDYYDGAQISPAERAALKKRKQAPVVINRIKPKIDGLAGMERTNRTTARAFPRTPKHDQDANASSEAIRFVLQDNFYNELRSAAWDNLTVEGSCGLEVMVTPYREDFKIKINHIPWDRLIYDVFDRTKALSKPRFLGQHIWLDYDEALIEYPNGKDVLENTIQGSNTTDDKPSWVDTIRKRVKVVELYYRQDGDWHYACFTYGGFLKDPKKSPFINEEGETEHPYEFASLFVDREGNRYGACLQYLDVQDEINKRRSKALHLMSVRQVMLERGAVEDVNKARQELARPDGVVEVTPGMEFEVLKTGDMAAAQFNLLQESKNEIDAVGYNAAVSGKENKSMSGVALENRRMAGQTEIATMFDVLRHLDIRIYRKIWNRIRQYWKAEKWIRVTDDQANVRFVGLNYKDPATGQVVNDVAQLDVDIVLDDAPDSVTMQQEEFVALSEMVKSGIPIPPTAIIEASNLKNKHKILQQMQQSQINPEAVKKMQEDMQKLAQENQLLKADQQTEQQKIVMKAQGDAAELQAKSAAQAEELRLERERAAAEIQLAREKAEAEIAIKVMTAKADAEIAQMEIATQSSQEEKKLDLEKRKVAGEQEIKRGEMAFEQQARMQEVMPDEEFKKYCQGMVSQTEMVPKMMEGVAEALVAFAKSMEGQNQALMKLAEGISRPKTVRLGGINRGNDGAITGASATVQ